MRNAAKVDPQALQQIFLNELNRGDAEAYILVRREDYMPIYARGNIETFAFTDQRYFRYVQDRS